MKYRGKNKKNRYKEKKKFIQSITRIKSNQFLNESTCVEQCKGCEYGNWEAYVFICQVYSCCFGGGSMSLVWLHPRVPRGIHSTDVVIASRSGNDRGNLGFPRLKFGQI